MFLEYEQSGISHKKFSRQDEGHSVCISFMVERLRTDSGSEAGLRQSATYFEIFMVCVANVSHYEASHERVDQDIDQILAYLILRS